VKDKGNTKYQDKIPAGFYTPVLYNSDIEEKLLSSYIPAAFGFTIGCFVRWNGAGTRCNDDG